MSDKAQGIRLFSSEDELCVFAARCPAACNDGG
jgi:hypothetical protein